MHSRPKFFFLLWEDGDAGLLLFPLISQHVPHVNRSYKSCFENHIIKVLKNQITKWKKTFPTT
jgi:hypothetical protein